VRRRCSGCVDSHKTIFFRRKTQPEAWDAYDGLLVTWRDAGFGTDFDIYSSLKDAKADTNAWKFCNGNDPTVGFPRDCGPEVYVPGQWTGLTTGQATYEYSVLEDWTVLYAKGSEYSNVQLSKEDFNEAFQGEGSGLVRRRCSGCVDSHKTIFFRRKTQPEAWDAYDGLLVTWRDAGFGTDFDIYSSLKDAKADTNAWKFCNGNDPTVGFPRDCGPEVYVPGQWTGLTTGQDRYEYSVPKNDEEPPLAMPVNTASGIQEPLSKVSIETAFMLDGTRPYIVKAGPRIFDFRISDVVIKGDSFLDARSVTGSSSRELSNSFSTQVGLEAEWGAFSAAVSVGTTSFMSSMWKTWRQDTRILAAKHKVELTLEAKNALQSRLTPAAKKILLTQSAKYIAEELGHFYAATVTLGGVIQHSHVIEMSTEDTASGLEASLDLKIKTGKLSMGFNTGIMRQTFDSFAQTRIATKWYACGGDGLEWLQLAPGFTNMNAIPQQWAKTASDENMCPIRPIWTLLEHDDMNNTQAKEVNNYLAQHLSHTTQDYPLKPRQPQEGDITSDITIFQPGEQAGSYRYRSTSRKACDVINSCKSVDALTCADGSRCLKWDTHCYAGRISLPKGVRAKLYGDFGCNTDFRKEITGPTTESSFWDYHKRACSFKFEAVTGHQCPP